MTETFPQWLAGRIEDCQVLDEILQWVTAERNRALDLLLYLRKYRPKTYDSLVGKLEDYEEGDIILEELSYLLDPDPEGEALREEIR